MKKTVLLATALGCLAQAQAQFVKGSPEEKKWKEGRALALRMLGAQFASGTAQKPTGTQHRVIAQAYRDFGGNTDSMTFKYSGTRGSRYNYNSEELMYPVEFQPWYAPRPMFPQVSDPMNLLADSVRFYESGIAGNLETATYRNDNKIINATSISGNPPSPTYHYRSSNVYNTQGHMITSYELESNDGGASYDTLSMVTTTYNSGFTQVLVDSAFDKTASGYELSGLIQYYYGSSGKADSILIVDQMSAGNEKIAFDYYTDGKLKLVTTTSSGFNMTDSFGYTSGIDYATLWDNKALVDLGGSPAIFGSRILRYPGTNSLPDSVATFDYDETTESWVPYETAVYTYTSFNAPESIEVLAEGEPFSSMHFYYETYEDGGVSIRPVAENTAFGIYPNPFRNSLNIDWKGTAQSKVSVRLVNLLGQEVYHTDLKLNAGSNTLAIPAISDGQYIMVIRDSEGKTWSSKVVKR